MEIPLLFAGYPGWYKWLGLIWFAILSVLIGARFFIEPTPARNGAASQNAEQRIENSPGATQIGNVGSLTFNQINAGKPETLSRLKSEVSRLLRFPNAVSDTSDPPTQLEAMLSNKLPYRLFLVLMTYDENDVANAPNFGSELHQFLTIYYQFREDILEQEQMLFPLIGEVVEGRLAPAWQLYLRYILLRFAGNTREQVMDGPNFLNFGITWDDAERVYQHFAGKPEIVSKFESIFTKYDELVKRVDTLKAAADLNWRSTN